MQGQIKTGAPCRSERLAKYNQVCCVPFFLRVTGFSYFTSAQLTHLCLHCEFYWHIPNRYIVGKSAVHMVTEPYQRSWQWMLVMNYGLGCSSCELKRSLVTRLCTRVPVSASLLSLIDFTPESSLTHEFVVGLTCVSARLLTSFWASNVAVWWHFWVVPRQRVVKYLVSRDGL